MPGKCKFNDEWLILDEFKDWLQKANDQKKAYCRLCYSSFDISNMGKHALISHSRSQKHATKKFRRPTTTMKDFLVDRPATPATDSTSSATASSATTSSATASSSSATATSGASEQNRISPAANVNVFDQSDKTRAEITWAMKTVTSHYSYKSCEDVGVLFKHMFPDSDIARNFTLGEKKCAYLVSFGLAPYFVNELKNSVKKNGHFVLLFDESENKRLQQKQLDLHVRMYDETQNMVVTRYLDSTFMGHATADDLVTQFHELTDKLPLQNLVQISMDGPNVNWAFFRKFAATMPENKLIDIGSCGLHILRGAFKDGLHASGWDVEDYLSSVYRLFKDSPARREDFIKITGSSVFPLKFCAHRWIENAPVATRAREMLPAVLKYINTVQADKTYTTPTCKAFETLKSISKDENLLEPKLCFLISVAEQFQPFLLKYQSDKPLLPFMKGDLTELLNGLLLRLVKPDIMAQSNSAFKLVNIDLDDEANLLVYNKIDLGFSADKTLKEIVVKGKVNERRSIEFKHSCRKWLLVSIKKLKDKSPLKYSLVRNCECFNPKKMASQPNVCMEQFQRVLVKLEGCGLVKENDCDSAKREYQTFLNIVVAANKGSFESFSLKDQSLDVFLRKFVSTERHLLWSVMKIILTLSHGQATVERGFSVNSQIVVENRKADCYKAQRSVYDHIMSVGGVMNVEITKALIVSAQGARQKYQMDQDRKKAERQETEKDRKRKKRLEEITEVKQKIRRVDDDIKSLESACDDYAEKAEKTGKREWFTKYNSLRKTVKEKQRAERNRGYIGRNGDSKPVNCKPNK